MMELVADTHDEIMIDEEFKSLLPPLDPQTFMLLEENLLENGCRDPLVLWNGILIDGHNRYEICTKHDIPFRTVSKDFASREEVLIWIITTQVARRNLSPMQLSYYRGLHYHADKRIIRNASGINQYSELRGQNDPKADTGSTAIRLAGQYHVSPKTIKRDAKTASALDAIGESSPTAKRRILSGEKSINKKALQELSSKPVEDIAEVALRIEDGTFGERSPEPQEQPAPLEPTADATPADELGLADELEPADKTGLADEAGAADASEPAASAETAPFEAAITKITDELLSALREHSQLGNAAELKMTLRSYINMLEVLYRSI